MNRERLVSTIRQKKSCLCVGLDLHPTRLPVHLGTGPEAWLTFNKEIIDATREYCVAYKPNWAFYEALGLEGLQVLRSTIQYIGNDHLIIADAKRGDIGNTSARYAEAVYDYFDADAITVAPYMGKDSLQPFYRDGKWIIALCLTSNPGSADYQKLELSNGKNLYEHILEDLAASFSAEEMMFVVGATHPDMFKKIRQIIPDHFLLVPGVGAQGGSIGDVMRNGANEEVGLLINSSRSIIYASNGKDFADASKKVCQSMQQEMVQYI